MSLQIYQDEQVVPTNIMSKLLLTDLLLQPQRENGQHHNTFYFKLIDWQGLI